MADPVKSALRRAKEDIHKMEQSPEYLPAHVGPLSRHTHPVYTKPPAEVGFGNAYAEAWDMADDIKKMKMVEVSRRLKATAHSPHTHWAGYLAADWLDSVKSVAPRVKTKGIGTVIPAHEERYGNVKLKKPL